MTNSELYYIKLTLKNKFESSDTIDVYLSTKAITSTDSTINYYPLLRSARLGNEIREYLPAKGTGSITIINERNSFGRNRKFSDLLEIYTPQGQPIEVYALDLDFTPEQISGGTLIWSDTVESYKTNPRSSTVTIQLLSEGIEDLVLTRELNSSDISGLPETSEGQHLPIVIGSSIDVNPVPLSSNDANCDYGYGTSFANNFKPSINKFYAKELSGDNYIEVKSTANHSTALLAYIASNGTIREQGAELGQEIAFNSTHNNMIHKVEFDVFGSGTNLSTVYGNVIVKLYEVDETDIRPLGSPLATCTAAKLCNNSLASNGANGIKIRTNGQLFTLGGHFDKAVPINTDRKYWLSFFTENDDPQDGGLLIFNTSTIDGGVIYQKGGASNSSNWDRVRTNQFISYRLFGLEINDVATVTDIDDRTGQGVTRFNVNRGAWPTQTRPSSPADYNLLVPDVSKLDLMAKVNGIKDNTSGAITGVANSLINKTHDIAKLTLGYSFNGSNWVANNKFNSDFKSASHDVFDNAPYKRCLAGKTNGRSSKKALLRELCRNSASRIVVTKDGRLGLYAWGRTETPVKTFTDAEIISKDYQSSTRNAIVNHIVLSYDKRDLNVDLGKIIEQGGARNYQKVLTMHYQDGGVGQEVSSQSFELFGLKELGDNTFNFINDVESANAIAQSILRASDIPPELIQLETTRKLADDLNLYDVIRVKSTQLPQITGTSPDPDPIIDENGDPIQFHGGEQKLTMARTYEAQIYDYVLSISNDDVAKVEITARLLIHPHDPT